MEEFVKAAIMRAKEIVVDEVPDLTPGPGEVLVETIACGICGSDLHALTRPESMLESAGANGMLPPFDAEQDVVMGHEFSARVLELGPGATGVEPGDAVVSMPMAMTAGGPQLIGYSNTYPGGYAEQMLLTAAMCIKVPESLDPRHAALTEPMAVGLHAVNKVSITANDTAVVLGCGPIGLAVIGSLKIAGVKHIVGSDFSPTRRKLAEGMGATCVVDPKQEPPMEALARTGGGANPVVFEAVGAPGVLDEAMRAAPRLGRIVVVGVCMDKDTIWPMLGITKELNIHFALGYDPLEFRKTLDGIASGEIDVAPLITGEVPIDGVAEAFKELGNPDAHAKILVTPQLG